MKTVEQWREEVKELIRGFGFHSALDYNEVISESTLSNLANKILSLFLDRTKDNCPECKWQEGYFVDSHGEICPKCKGTGKGEPHPERLVVLAKDQSFPPLPETVGCESIYDNGWFNGYMWLRNHLTGWRKVEGEGNEEVLSNL